MGEMHGMSTNFCRQFSNFQSLSQLIKLPKDTGRNLTGMERLLGVVSAFFLNSTQILTLPYILYFPIPYTLSTADAKLTPLGEDQARAANKAWCAELPFNIPVPTRNARFCSPMTRAIKTYLLSFAFDLANDEKKDKTKMLELEGGKKPVIIEVCKS
jgi:hypothetical protein